MPLFLNNMFPNASRQSFHSIHLSLIIAAPMLSCAHKLALACFVHFPHVNIPHKSADSEDCQTLHVARSRRRVSVSSATPMRSSISIKVCERSSCPMWNHGMPELLAEIETRLSRQASCDMKSTARKAAAWKAATFHFVLSGRAKGAFSGSLDRTTYCLVRAAGSQTLHSIRISVLPWTV